MKNLAEFELHDSLLAMKITYGLTLRHKKPELMAALYRYYRELNHCNIILSRIETEYNIVQEYHEGIRIKNKTRIPSDTFWENSCKLTFDIEDYFIHVKILLDRITQIIGCLIPDLPPKVKTRFHKHRNHFKKDTHGYNEYAKYLEKMSWYDNLIRIFRDDLVVHDDKSEMSWQGGTPDTITIHKSRSIDEKGLQKFLTKLYEIQDNHKNDIPELENESNIWHRLEILDKNVEKLDTKEQGILFNMHKQVGGTFPEVKNVNKKIQEFIDFIGSHFELNPST